MMEIVTLIVLPVQQCTNCKTAAFAKKTLAEEKRTNGINKNK